jgi:GDP-L-fucose synthase
MIVLVTGGSGMVGKNLLEYLKEKTSCEVISPTSFEMNLLNYASVKENLIKYNPDVVIHCAGLVGGIQANIEKPFSFLSINMQMGLNLINVSIELKIKRLINLGSSCMYPKDLNEALREGAILTGTLEPTNEGYAIAKIAIAKLCEYAEKEYGLRYKTIIPCNLYGKYDNFSPENSHMVPAVIRKTHKALRRNSEVEIWGNGKARREFMYAGDLADFILFSLTHYDKFDSITNVGLGHDYTILEYYKTIADVIGYSGRFKFDLTKPVGMKRKLNSIKKQSVLGWQPKHTLKEGIIKINEYYIQNYEI